MKRLVLIAALCACNKQADGFRSTGTLVFDAREAADVFLATETEVMRSEPILRRIREDLRMEIAPTAITAKRRAGTMLVDITVRDKDPQHAAELCNRLMMTYLEYRRSLAIEGLMQQQAALGEALDKDPNNADLQRRLQELDVQRMTQGCEVRVLDPCKVPSKRT